MRKLVRDKVISIVDGKALVGVYWDGTDGSEILFELSPVKLFGKKLEQNFAQAFSKGLMRRMRPMKNQMNGNGRINNTQRRELTKLAVGMLDKKVQQARDESGDLVAQIREQAREELGVAAMDMEIEAMEERIRVLKKKKEQLGFNQYHNGLLPGSKAKMLVDERTSTTCKKVKELEEKKTDVISGIWASTTLSQALSILESVKRL